MEYKALTIFAAYILDLIFGDPRWNWHPTRLIGRLIEWLEHRLNIDNVDKSFTGVILVILAVSVTIICVGLSLKLAQAAHPVIYFVFSVLFIYFAISVKDLGKEAAKVKQALLKKDIQRARQNLSMIAGRDTADLSESEVIRGTVETVAESTMDGIVAPLFYAFLGGPVFAWAYKAINTLDSMVGYRNERFICFGKAAAKLDGLINLIPAKITCFLIFISGWGYRSGWLTSGKWVGRYFFKGSRYNSEATEAVMAGVLGVQLGGINFYGSVTIQKDLIGDNIYPLEIKHIKESMKIAYISSFLFVVIGIFLFWVMRS